MKLFCKLGKNICFYTKTILKSEFQTWVVNSLDTKIFKEQTF